MPREHSNQGSLEKHGLGRLQNQGNKAQAPSFEGRGEGGDKRQPPKSSRWDQQKTTSVVELHGCKPTPVEGSIEKKGVSDLLLKSGVMFRRWFFSSTNSLYILSDFLPVPQVLENRNRFNLTGAERSVPGLHLLPTSWCPGDSTLHVPGGADHLTVPKATFSPQPCQCPEPRARLCSRVPGAGSVANSHPAGGGAVTAETSSCQDFECCSRLATSGLACFVPSVFFLELRSQG